MRTLQNINVTRPYGRDFREGDVITRTDGTFRVVAVRRVFFNSRIEGCNYTHALTVERVR